MEHLPQGLPKLTAQEKLDIIYEANLNLFRSLIAFNPNLAKDPNEFEVQDGTTIKTT